jgi:hypothetical protein
VAKCTKNYSRQEAEALNPRHLPNTCMISINNPPFMVSPHNKTWSRGPADLRSGWDDIIVMEFWDVTMSETNPEFQGYPPMTEEQGKQIAEFIMKNYEKNIFVHCQAGISRSAAVVSVLLDLGWEPIFKPRIERANVHVRSLIKKHFPQLMPIGYTDVSSE